VDRRKEQTTVKDDTTTTRDRWARLRFAIVGPLLAAPPKHGALREEITRLGAKTWRHPVTDEQTRFGFSTIERWYYMALAAARDPIGALTRERRKGAGEQPSMKEPVVEVLREQYEAHKAWTCQLHYDNLVALERKRKELAVPSYATVRRFMKRSGLRRYRPPGPRGSPGAERAAARLENREVRSYEVEYAHGLWHIDGHTCRRLVLTRDGRWVKPVLVAALDDCSRLICHAQWYYEESAETVAHCLGQAFQKRKLPRAVMSDRGGANLAEETENGFVALSVIHELTLGYSPYQNAKLECFWASIEGRLMAQLEGVKDLTLELLNEATQAHVELEYHRKPHREIGTPPLRRYLDVKDVGRPSPTAEAVRRAFRVREWRTVRRSDLTVSVEGVRYEVPSRYRILERVCVAYARWDLSTVDMVDPETKTVLATLYPLDKTKNADGRRRVHADTLATTTEPPLETGIAPLLARLMEEYRATGLPPAYLPIGPRANGEGDEASAAEVTS
jgi:transposase InsO family protein